MGAEVQAVVDQYEALRREALDVAPFGPRGHGLALLLARGLPTWLTALTTFGLPPRRPVAEPGVERAPRLLPAARVELTTVLAGLVLACAEPSERSS